VATAGAVLRRAVSMGLRTAPAFWVCEHGRAVRNSNGPSPALTT
jgi:hypothetical protein